MEGVSIGMASTGERMGVEEGEKGRRGRESRAREGELTTIEIGTSMPL